MFLRRKALRLPQGGKEGRAKARKRGQDGLTSAGMCCAEPGACVQFNRERTT